MTADERVAVVAPPPVGGIAAQTRAPDEVFTGIDGLRRAHASGARWIWVLEGGGDPRPDALERLLDAQAPRDSEPRATIVAGAVMDGGGRMHEPSVPGFRIERADVIDLIGRGLLPIRHTTFANCLLTGDCLTRHGFPDTDRFGPFAAIEWSARVLLEREGYFDPSSVVVAAAPTPPAGGPSVVGSVPALAHMLRSGAWSRGDQLAAVKRALRRPATSPAAPGSARRQPR